MLGRTRLAATVVAATALIAPPALAQAAVRHAVGLGNGDAGRAVTVRSGDTVRVSLKAVPGDGMNWVWDEPTTSDGQVLSRSSVRTVAHGDAEATFDAQAAGRAAVTAHRRCVVTAPGHVCPRAVALWKVTLDVR
ncbi:hypothetical protein ABT247_14680 [Kitasatospora sp. NPDC001539]|uniref:hypothetical protein n=1 Tax=Kitasatospora sp. NPDC001539 TaxID=3154384 RepID=UPI00332ADF96